MNAARLAAALAASWSAETIDHRDSSWDAADPSRGQCGVTALVVRDHLGGDLVLAAVTGEGSGWHYWNRLPSGEDLDLTREQFRPGEVVGAGRVVMAPDGFGGGPLAAQYALLSTRVREHLERHPAEVSVPAAARTTTDTDSATGG